MRFELVVRFDYGRIVPWVRRMDGALVAVAGPDALCLWSPIDTHGEDMTTVADLTLEEGERLGFVLTWFPSHEAMPEPVDAERALGETEGYWLDWAATLTSAGDYHEEINESLVVLKAMTYAPSGGIVAAPTSSLPEAIGGERNWDYRFCWLRDATLTLLAMLKAGSREEAERWSQWFLRAVAGDPADIQVMYGVAGERRLDELELDWLPGYEGSTPVRIGNAACSQLQLDVYGEILDAIYQLRVKESPPDANVWSLMLKLLGWLEDGWRQQDTSIWEIRGPVRDFTHSKVMAWVAFDRAIRSHDEFGLDGPVDRWRELRQAIADDVLAKSWSDRKQAFAQSYGSDDLDASILLMPHVGFLPATDDRFRSTVDAIRDELVVDGLVLRYRTRDDGAVDGLPAGEGVFLPCSFWLADVLAMQGNIDEARELFERLLDLRNDVGLLSEEFDPRAGRMLGNFPQAFTHLAIINTAFVLREGRSLRAPAGS